MTSQSNPKLDPVPATREDCPSWERRSAPRFRLRDVRGRVTWRGAAGELACEVRVLNISGGGAAVLAEDAPRVGQSLRLSLHCESARMEPVEAQLLHISLDAFGKQVLHLRFARYVVLDALLEAHRERRLWERYPARESRASLTWFEGGDEKTVPGDLLNISGGGAAFISEVLPPPGVPIWLGLEAGARQVDRIDPVESRLVATSDDPSGMQIAHLQFVDPCPMDFFELAVNGLG
jgi:hypothetical protein